MAKSGSKLCNSKICSSIWHNRLMLLEEDIQYLQLLPVMKSAKPAQSLFNSSSIDSKKPFILVFGGWNGIWIETMIDVVQLEGVNPQQLTIEKHFIVWQVDKSSKRNKHSMFIHEKNDYEIFKLTFHNHLVLTMLNFFQVWWLSVKLLSP